MLNSLARGFKAEIKNLKELSDEKSVDSAFKHVRQLLSRPPSIFDAFAAWAVSLGFFSCLTFFCRNFPVSVSPTINSILNLCSCGSWAGPLPSLEMVAEGQVFASPGMLRFRDPDSFVAGNFTSCLGTKSPCVREKRLCACHH